MSQYSQGGHISGGQQHPAQQGDWIGRQPSPGYPRPQGTPLGRIVAGVFLGLLAWSALMVVVMVVLGGLAATAISKTFDDTFDDTSISDNGTTPSSDESALSKECKASLDAGGSGTTGECDADDGTEIYDYLTELGRQP